ncbi:radical SAM protein [Treponema primitia]|uniref:B12-binding domain-containing radical SAM protein n=1 Tax=Treponema primitia TaxID=88058 RepID=UPI00398114CA
MFCLVQPPLVQLNSPYPAPYYLKTFLEGRGYQVRVQDHSIGLFERIFCRSGLERIFVDAQKAGKPKNKNVFYNIDRFLSEEDRWLSSIDRLIDFLRGRDREFGHLLALANGVLPGGPRFDACLDSLDGNPLSDDAPLLASKLLADLADFITVTVDPSFSLVRYAGSVSAGLRDFSAVEQGLNSYILREFYRPLLEDHWDALDRLIAAGNDPLTIGVTIPFPGCLAGALVCAASAKARYGSNVTTIAGGGYVNTELRFMDELAFFNYFDYLSFDRGYGSLAAILEHTGDTPVYKTKYRSRLDGHVISDPGIDSISTLGEIDRDAVQTVFPDYSAVDFSRYLRPVDDLNPMHRLWSDGRWLKAYLAHGCYWHACAFCDVQLDYIRCFEPLEPLALFRHLQDQAEKTGVRGIHLVDEAAPPDSLLRLALLNREAGLPLSFWGNIRFEKDFTPDTTAILAAGGLVGVSGGIEVAAEEGFKRIGKGIGLGDVVNACAAFKEAGILTHAYLIYGYWDQDDQEIIDSAEILRQLFAAGLLDSAFWHKFVLTRHSRIYAEWKRGKHPELIVTGDGKQRNLFALNDLSFAGEEKFDRFTGPLDQLLTAWMAGETSAPVKQGFPFTVPKPNVAADLVAGLLDDYARNRDCNRTELPAPGKTDRVLFLGSRPMVQNTAGGLFWRWRLEDRLLPIGSNQEKAAAAVVLLEKARRSNGLGTADFYRDLARLLGDSAAKKAWNVLRESGLVQYKE